MNQHPLATTERTPATLSLLCLAHLQQEEGMLAETLDSLQQVRAALHGGNLASLRAAIDRQAHVARASLELKNRRTAIRRELADTLGTTPESVTLSMLASQLTHEARTQLAHCRERLVRMAGEIEQLNQANARLVGHSLDFLERFFIDITGGDHGGARYGPAGTTRGAAVGSMIEAQG